MSKLYPTELQAVLFDLDGTLLDTAPDFADVLGQLSDMATITPPAYADVHKTVSNGARALVRLTFGIDDQHPRFQEHLDTLLALYAKRIENTKSRFYPGMEHLLSSMEKQGILWGVVTNKPTLYSVALLRSMGLLERCAVLICPDDVTQSKPHPEPLFLACSRLGIDAGNAIYVGDHPRDIEAGNAAGMYTIAVTYGYLPPSPAVEDWGADLIVDQVAAIGSALQGAQKEPLLQE